MLTIRLSQSCCWFFDVARHTTIDRTHRSAFATLWGVGRPAGRSEAPPGVPKKYSKTRIEISTRQLFVPGVSFLVRNSTRHTSSRLAESPSKQVLDGLWMSPRHSSDVDGWAFPAHPSPSNRGLDGIPLGFGWALDGRSQTMA